MAGKADVASTSSTVVGQTVLKQLVTALDACDTVADYGGRLVEIAADLLPIDYLVILARSSLAGPLVVPAPGVVLSPDVDAGTLHAISEVVRQRGRTLIVNNPAEFIGSLAGTRPTSALGTAGAFIATPITGQRQTLGALVAVAATPTAYTPHHAAWLEVLAQHVGLALSHGRRHRTRVEPVRRALDTIDELARRLVRAPTSQAIAEVAVEVCAGVFGTGKATLHQYDPATERLTMASAYGLTIPTVTATASVALGIGPYGRAAAERRLIVITNTRNHPDCVFLERLDETDGIAGIWSMPLLADGDDLLGTITVYHHQPRQPTTDEQKLFRLLSYQVTGALQRVLLADHSRELYRASVGSLAAAVDAKDPFTHNHSWQVAAYSRAIAETLGLPASEIEIIELAGLLHDVGKIGIPDRVLQKPDRLDPDEWAMMQRHAELGASILGDNPALAAVVPLVRHHHERYDGHGYPDGLSGDALPLGAAIVGLADAFDTMTSNRPYRTACALDEALAEVQRCSGTHFHPRVVTAFLDAVRSGKIAPASRPPRTSTRELRLQRAVGVDARAFGLLQRISAEVRTLVDIRRFLYQLAALVTGEFPGATCDIFIRDNETGELLVIPRESEPTPGQTGLLARPHDDGIADWVASHGASQNVVDVRVDPRYQVTDGDMSVRSELALPLMADGDCIGVLALKHPEVAAFTASDQQVLEMVTTYVAQAIEVAQLHTRLRRQADLDAMTGLLNHRAFYHRLQREIERRGERGKTFAIAILDIDGLKAINDMRGHVAGDAVIRRVANVLRANVRPGDTAARYGGDEFAIIVPDVSRDAMEARLAAIDRQLASAAPGEPTPHVSWGVAVYPEDGRRETELVSCADGDMYAHKMRSGSPG